MPAKRTKKIHDVECEQLQFGQKWYTTVDDRAKIARVADSEKIRSTGKGFHVVSAQVIPMGERFAFMVMVEYPIGSGIVMSGTDFIDLKDNAGIAKAETSAIGRALGFHGIASEDGIASANEMERLPRSAYEDREQSAKTVYTFEDVGELLKPKPQDEQRRFLFKYFSIEDPAGTKYTPEMYEQIRAKVAELKAVAARQKATVQA